MDLTLFTLLPQTPDKPLSKNPLFQDPPKVATRPLPQSTSGVVKTSANPAINLIRRKLSVLYAKEPDANTVARESAAAKPPSKHQKFMQQLTASGKSFAEIQTEWHNYYLSLPDNEKHEVWQEFYEANELINNPQPRNNSKTNGQNLRQLQQPTRYKPTRLIPGVSKSAYQTHDYIRQGILSRVKSRAGDETKRSIKSLGFGLGVGIIVIFIFLFGFSNATGTCGGYNQRSITYVPAWLYKRCDYYFIEKTE